MDNIYTLLKKIGVEIPTDKKASFEEELVKNYKTIADYNNLHTKLDESEKTKSTIKQQYDDDIAKRDNDLKSLQTQLTDAGENSEKLTELTEKFNTLSNEYAGAKTQYETQLNEQRYKFLATNMTDKLKFSSNSAKKSFYNDLMNKKLQLENDTLLGFDDFTKIYKEQDPSAFIVEDNNSSEPKPTFSSKSVKLDNQTTIPTTKPKVW